MLTCTLCRFETELDDAVVVAATGHCICLRCFERETGSTLPMPKSLQRELAATLDEVEAV